MSTDHNEQNAEANLRATPVLDCEQIDGLVAAAGVDGTREILDAFWRSSESLIRDLQAQIGAGDLAEASRTAHALKGSSLNVGAVRLSIYARAIEDACHIHNTGDAAKSLKGVETHYAETVEAFNAHLTAAA